MRKKRIIARKNAQPEIVGRWLAASQPAAKTPSNHKGRSLAAMFEQIQADREQADPRGYADLAQMLSTSPRTIRLRRDDGNRRQLPNVVRDELVPHKGLPAIDERELVLAMVEFVNLTYESTVGIGRGGLFNFEYELVLRLIEIGRRLRADRVEADRAVYRQRLLDHISKIYQCTANAWRAPLPTNRVLVPGVLTAHQKRLMSEQRDALDVLFKQAKFRMPLSRATRTGADIRRAGGPIKTAANLLDDLDQLSASALIKERKRVSPLFEHRATEQPFPVGSGNEATATRFARFAYALYRAAADVRTPAIWSLIKYKDAPDDRDAFRGVARALGRPFPISVKRGDLPDRWDAAGSGQLSGQGPTVLDKASKVDKE